MKRWDAVDVLPERNPMRGYVTLFHDDGFAYDLYGEEVGLSQYSADGLTLAPWGSWERIVLSGLLQSMEEERRLTRNRSRLPYKPLALHEMDDSTIRPCGPGVWIRDTPPSPPVAAP